MKKILFVLVMGVSVFAIAQENDTNQNELPSKKHELRIDVLEALAIPNIEINYEYVISKYSGAGAAISFSLDDGFSEYQQYAFTPYYRQYFFNKKEYGARGFFVEGLLKFAGGDDSYENDGYNGDDFPTDFTTGGGDWFNAGVGVAIGQKWVSNNGFVFELSAGGGRYLLNPDFGPDGFFRGGVLVGYRF